MLAGLTNSENVSSASLRANALSSGSAIFQCNLLRVVYFNLGPALNAVRFHISLLVRTYYISHIIHIIKLNATLFPLHIVFPFCFEPSTYSIFSLKLKNYRGLDCPRHISVTHKQHLFNSRAILKKHQLHRLQIK